MKKATQKMHDFHSREVNFKNYVTTTQSTNRCGSCPSGAKSTCTKRTHYSNNEFTLCRPVVPAGGGFFSFSLFTCTGFIWPPKIPFDISEKDVVILRCNRFWRPFWKIARCYYGTVISINFYMRWIIECWFSHAMLKLVAGACLRTHILRYAYATEPCLV